jgi:hypothetical protein
MSLDDSFVLLKPHIEVGKPQQEPIGVSDIVVFHSDP